MRGASGVALCVGECMVEFFEAGDGCWRRGFAGDTLNVAWAMRALLPDRHAVGYVTRVGCDDVSDAMVGFIGAAGIDTARVQRDAARTVGLYTIATDETGERSFSYWRSASAARHLADDATALDAAFGGAGLIYLSGITAAVLGAPGRAGMLRALEVAKASGARIAYDPNYRPRLWESAEAMRAFTPRVAALADIVLPTFDDEAAGFGDASPADTVARLAGWGCGEVVVKNGTEPTLVATTGETRAVAPARRVKPVDTTGAGDSFNGGYLAARLGGADPVAATRHAQAVAATVVLERGALVAPDRLRAAVDEVPPH